MHFEHPLKETLHDKFKENSPFHRFIVAISRQNTGGKLSHCAVA